MSGLKQVGLSFFTKVALPLAVTFLLCNCTFMLEKKGASIKDVDEDEIRQSFSDGTRTLPVMFMDIEGGGGINNKEYWKDAEIKIYTPEGHTPEYDISFKGRGNSTWSFPKKPFNIKFEDSKVSLLGMPESDRWCMLANWRDRTKLRNPVALEIARQTSMEWTPQGRFVDLVVEGEWYGNYLLTERVEPENLNLGTDGFLLFVDDHYDKTYRFRSKLRNFPVNIITGDIALDAKRFAQIRKIVDDTESAICNNTADWKQKIDIQSFCDWFLIQELVGNDEPSDPKGIYMYCRADGVLHAGPCWDYDYHTFRPGVSGLINGKALWFDVLLTKPEFKTCLKERWAVIKPLIEDYIPAYISQLQEYIHESALLDATIWPIKHIKNNGDEQLGFDEAVERLKLGLSVRMAFLDSYCAGL